MIFSVCTSLSYTTRYLNRRIGYLSAQQYFIVLLLLLLLFVNIMILRIYDILVQHVSIVSHLQVLIKCNVGFSLYILFKQ